MNEPQSPRWRPALTILVLLAEVAHLSWETLHGGIRAHHLLNRADLPAISNLWGLLFLPALSWFASGRVLRRTAASTDGSAAPTRIPVSVVAGVVGPLLAGILLSAAFTSGQTALTESIFEGMLLLSLLLPVYRAECLLGFVLGMTFTFGAVLPTAVGSILAALSAAIHLAVWPVLRHLGSRLKRA